ncbi:hypothetical protein V6N11_032216 [Hibiscus sabdariffa]|uniref:Thioesterase domain-containing protein n=1 Tax=Hibiscus sabdariffa TaxID=183260 RepID=A0ABR2T004_9ROSI
MEGNGSLGKSLKWLKDPPRPNRLHTLQFHRSRSRIDGNWHVGAMATLIDDVGAAAIYSVADHVKASLDFNISFHTTAKIHEEVEIEAKVVGEKGKLSLVVVEIRKRNGELIALGKQWMATTKDSRKASQESKL